MIDIFLGALVATFGKLGAAIVVAVVLSLFVLLLRDILNVLFGLVLLVLAIFFYILAVIFWCLEKIYDIVF